MRLEVAVNQTCNAQCEHCNRAIGMARFKELDLTAEQMGRAVDRMLEQGVEIHAITFGGGEPALNKDFQGILDHASRLPNLRDARVLTNNMPAGEKFREVITLPPLRDPKRNHQSFRWVPSPLDNPLDPKSGKAKHRPFFHSPADSGLESKFSQCRVKGWCGKGLDATGWSMCGIAGTLARLLQARDPQRDYNPYTHEGFTREEKAGICQHCIYGLKEDEQHQLFKRIGRGKLPIVSPTFREGFEAHKENPVEYPRL